MEITSTTNELVKETAKLQQKKYRDIEDKFLLEGFKVIKGAYDLGIDITSVFVLKEHEGKYNFLKNKIILTNEAVLKKISTTDSAPEAIAVGVQKHFTASSLKEAKKVVLLENVKDLGNLGSILRSSAAFGFDGVVLFGRETADLYNPKCVRASVGNLWKLPVIKLRELNELKNIFKDFDRIATLPRAENNLKNIEVKSPLLIMFGSEADGLSQELTDFATKTVKIDMKNEVESLNLSSCAAIVLYELA